MEVALLLPPLQLCALLLFAALMGLCCGSLQSCSSDHTGLAEFALQNFMAKPFEPIGDSRTGLRAGSWSFMKGEPEMRHWFLHQVWLHHSVGEGFMIYAGTEDGVFSGYGISGDGSIWYTMRNPKDSNPQSYNWSGSLAHPALPFERSLCATGVTCRYQSAAWGCAATSSTSCRKHTTVGGITCPTKSACKTEQLEAGGTWAVQSGSWLARNCTSRGSDGGGESNSTGFAAGLAQALASCGHSDCVDQSLIADLGTMYSPLSPGTTTTRQVSGCVDHDVRLYYRTNDFGPTRPFRWRMYDPRVRVWYTTALARWRANTSRAEGWSPLYTFASNQGVGLTATRVVTDPSNASKVLGVFGVDYALTTLDNFIKSRFGGNNTGSLSVMLVDRETGTLLASSSTILHPQLATCQARGSCPMSHPDQLIRQSALHLNKTYGRIANWPSRYSNVSGSASWPQPQWLGSTTVERSSYRVFEVTTKQLEDRRGLNWLIVAGVVQLRQCRSGTMQPDAQHLHCECSPGYRKRLSSDEAPKNELDVCIMCKTDVALCCKNEKSNSARRRCSEKSQLEPCVECHGDDRVFARAGYFVSRTSETLKVFRCSKQLCTGVSVLDDSSTNPQCPVDSRIDSLGNCCPLSQRGTLCGGCADGYSWGDDGVCLECRKTNTAQVAAFVLLYIGISLFIGLRKHCQFIFRCSKGRNQGESRFNVRLMGLDLPKTGDSEFQTLTFCMQTVSLLNIETAEEAMAVLRAVFNMEFNRGSERCMLFFANPTGKFMFDLLVPILFLFSAVTLLHGVIVAVIRGRRRSTLSSQSSNQGPFQNRSFWHKLRAAYLDVVIFAAMPVMTKSAAWLHCRPGDTTPDGTARVLNAPSVRCDGADYYWPASIALVCLLAIGLGFPALVVWKLHLRTAKVPSVELGSHTFYVDGIDTVVSDSRGFDEMCSQLKARAVNMGFACAGVDWTEPGLQDGECKELILKEKIDATRRGDPQHEDPMWSKLDTDGDKRVSVHELSHSTSWQCGNLVIPGRSATTTWKTDQLRSLNGLQQAELQKQGVKALVALMLAHIFEVLDQECPETDKRSESEGGCVLSVGVSLPEWPNRKAWAYVTFKHKDTCKFLLQRTGNVAVIGDTTSVHMVDLNLLWTLGNFGDSKELWMGAQTKLNKLKSTLYKRELRRIRDMGDVVVDHKEHGDGRGKSYLRSIFFASDVDGSQSRRDWLGPLYSGVRESCWWWPGALLLRRCAISIFAGRRDESQFEVFGTSIDWRTCVVLTLAINVFLSAVFLPYKELKVNYFNDFSILVVLILFVMNLSGEKYFFAFLVSLAALILVPIVVVKVFKGASQQKKTKINVHRLRDTGLKIGRIQRAAVVQGREREDAKGLRRAITNKSLDVEELGSEPDEEAAQLIPELVSNESDIVTPAAQQGESEGPPVDSLPNAVLPH